MTQNYRMIVESTQNRIEWLAVQFLGVECFLYLMEDLAKWPHASCVPKKVEKKK